MFKKSQNFYRNSGTRLSIGKRMMVVFQVIAAGLGDGVELVVREEFTEMTTGGPAGPKELIIRVIHLVAAKHGLQAALVEGTVVGHKRQPFDKRRYLLPHVRKN